MRLLGYRAMLATVHIWNQLFDITVFSVTGGQFQYYLPT